MVLGKITYCKIVADGGCEEIGISMKYADQL